MKDKMDMPEGAIVLCYLCREPILANEEVRGVPMLEFYGHAYCLKLSKRGLDKAEIRQRYLMLRDMYEG